MIFFYIFLNFAQNINCGYTSNYQQSMFWSKNKKKIGIPLHTSVLLYKSGVFVGIRLTDMLS